MRSAPVNRFASPLQRLYRKLTRKSKSIPRTTYMTASPVLVSPQPSLKAIQTELIFITDCKAPFPSIDSLLALLEPAEQQPPLFIAVDSPIIPASLSIDQTSIEEYPEAPRDAVEEQVVAESVVMEEKEAVEESSAEEERSEALFGSSDEDSSDVSSIITITTASTPSTPASPRFNPSFERSTPAETYPAALLTSTIGSDLLDSPSGQDIPTWISLTTKSIRFNPSFERSPSSSTCAEFPSPPAGSPLSDSDAPHPFVSSKSASSLVIKKDNIINTFLPSAATSSERYPSFISWDSPSPPRHRLVQRVYSGSSANRG